jgi:peroxiredoxin
MPVVIAVAPLATKEERQIVFSHLKKVIEEEQPQVIGIWVERKYEHLKFLNQMKLSYQKLSEEDFEQAYRYRESPQKEEGFDDIYYIIMDEEIGISQSSYGIQPLTNLLDTI